MLTTILGSLIGFGSSFFPKVLDYFQDKRDKQHELDLIDKQIQMQKELQIQKLDEVVISSQSAENVQIQKNAGQLSGVKWVDAMNSIVRPVITFSFFLLFAAYESSLFYIMLSSTGDVSQSIANAWNENVMGLFATIMSFWFGGRVYTKLSK